MKTTLSLAMKSIEIGFMPEAIALLHSLALFTTRSLLYSSIARRTGSIPIYLLGMFIHFCADGSAAFGPPVF